MMLENINILLFIVTVHSSFGYSYIQADAPTKDGYNRRAIFLDHELNFMRPIKGAAVIAHPIEACSFISAPPVHQLEDDVNWFVLIREGGCSAKQKALMAYQAGYSAAIIYLLETPKWLTRGELAILSIRLQGHLSNVSFPNITVVVTGGLAAEQIMEKFLYSVNPESRLIIERTVFDLFQVLMFVVAIVVIFICTVLLSLIIRRVSHSRRNQGDRLSARSLRRLETTRYRQGDPYDTCAICFEDFKEKDKLRILPCAHGYHCKCIDPWLLNVQRTCPICKQKIILPEDRSRSSDAESGAERTPLLQDHARHLSSHGTFDGGQNVPDNVQTSPYIDQLCSGETPARDAPSEILDNDPCEKENILVKGYFSAPNISTHARLDEVPFISETQEHSEFDADAAGCSFITQQTVSSNSVSINEAKPKQPSSFKPYVV